MRIHYLMPDIPCFTSYGAEQAPRVGEKVKINGNVYVAHDIEYDEDKAVKDQFVQIVNVSLKLYCG